MVKAVEGRGFGFVGLGLARGWGAQLVVGFATGLGLITLIVALETATGHLRLRLVASEARDFSPLLLGFDHIGLGIIAVLANLTALQRIWIVRAQARRR